MSASTPKKGHGRGSASPFAGYMESGEPSFPELVAARERMLERLLRARSPHARLALAAEAATCGLVVEAAPDDNGWGGDAA